MNPMEKIEEARKKKGVTKTHIANHCGKTVTWYADIAKGRRRVYLDDFIKIAESLGEEASNFFNQKVSVTRSSRNTNKSA